MKAVKLYLAPTTAPETNGKHRHTPERDQLAYLERAVGHLLESEISHRKRIERLESLLRDLGLGKHVRNPRGYYRRPSDVANVTERV